MIQKIAILGSTGSIGKNAVAVIEALGEQYHVEAITAHSNVDLLAQQAKHLRVKYAGITDEKYAPRLKELLSGTSIELLAGAKCMVDIAAMSDIDTIITAVVGAAGLKAVLEGARCGKRLAIANKEPLVMAGHLLTQIVRDTGAEILPVDSEHSAIFQAMQAGNHDEINRIILTSSGGPFRDATVEQMANVTKAQALNHPTWNMGPKITIDSATMMNKSLEVIEARWLFDMPVEKIDVLIHPEAIIHSLVEYIDGSVIAQMGTPDMCLPIQYALTWPKRLKGITTHLDFAALGQMNFHSPNLEMFRSLKLCFQVAAGPDSAAVVFNAVNEAAVELFLNDKIKFPQIVEFVERGLDEHSPTNNLDLEGIMDCDRWARLKVKEYLKAN